MDFEPVNLRIESYSDARKWMEQIIARDDKVTLPLALKLSELVNDDSFGWYRLLLREGLILWETPEN